MYHAWCAGSPDRSSTNALGHDLVHRLDQIRSNPQLRGLGRYVAAFDQLGVSFGDFKRRLSALGPEPDVKFMLADAKIAHRQIRQPSRKRRVDIELIARGVWEKSQQ